MTTPGKSNASTARKPGAERRTRDELVALGHAAARRFKATKGRKKAEPTAVELGVRSPVGDDEVVVIVLSKHAALVSSTTVKGRVLDVAELRRRLAGAELAVERLAGSAPVAPAPALAKAEGDLLDAAGFVDAGTAAGGALERARLELDMMLGESLSLEDAAKALSVSTGRLRQRLGPASRTLYGVKDGRAWRIPRFQLATKNKLVRGIDRVLPRIRDDAHPLAVAAWFAQPHQDLVVGADETPVTPRAWLLAGRDPDAVAALATEI